MMSFDYQMLHIQCQIFKTEYITKINMKQPSNPPIHIHINRINTILAFKIKGGYRLKLLTPATTKLFGSTKELINKKHSGENILEVVELV